MVAFDIFTVNIEAFVLSVDLISLAWKLCPASYFFSLCGSYNESREALETRDGILTSEVLQHYIYHSNERNKWHSFQASEKLQYSVNACLNLLSTNSFEEGIGKVVNR